MNKKFFFFVSDLSERKNFFFASDLSEFFFRVFFRVFFLRFFLISDSSEIYVFILAIGLSRSSLRSLGVQGVLAPRGGLVGQGVLAPRGGGQETLVVLGVGSDPGSWGFQEPWWS